jgi:hypothetical protein
LALAHGFKRRGKRNWLRRTDDFIQLLNLQGSQWAKNDNYLNFALWPLALGEPPVIAEHKFHLRMRAGSASAETVEDVFTLLDGRMRTLKGLRSEDLAYATVQLQTLLAARP